MKRLVACSIAALLSAAPVAAQQPSPMPVRNPIGASFIGGSTRYGGLLVAAFDSIPASRYGFKPTPVQMSVVNIAQHLESANYQICSGMSGQPWAMTAKDSLADSIKAMWPKDTLVARLRASLQFCDHALANLNDDQLPEQVHAGPPGSNRTISRVRYALVYVTDLAEHYAQLASYMRIMGLVPPSALPRPR